MKPKTKKRLSLILKIEYDYDGGLRLFSAGDIELLLEESDCGELFKKHNVKVSEIEQDKLLTPTQLKRLHFNKRKTEDSWTLLGVHSYLEYIPVLNELFLSDGLIRINLNPDYKTLKKFIELNKQFS